MPFIQNIFLQRVLITGLGLMLAAPVTAQTFTTLHSFTNGYTDTGGGYSGWLLSGNTLYGTTEYGGSSLSGTVFKANTDGTGFTILYSFTASGPFGSHSINSDGAQPHANLILSGNTLYGVASGGGSSGYGTVFKVNTDGTGFAALHSFTATTGPYPSVNSDGANPVGLILSGNTLYGTAAGGGSSGNGTVFKISTTGTGFATLHSFTTISAYPLYANSDGAYPAGLILSGNTLYGTAIGGGSAGNGTVFKISTTGTGFTTLHSFTTVSAYPLYANSDGAYPHSVTISGNTLYGTAVAEVRAMARCSRLTPMVPVLRPCTVSRQCMITLAPTVVIVLTSTELSRFPD